MQAESSAIRSAARCHRHTAIYKMHHVVEPTHGERVSIAVNGA